MQRLFIIFSLLGGIFLSGQFAKAKVYVTSVPAQARTPFSVDGTVVYKEFVSPRGETNFLLPACALFHGHGFNQPAIDFLKQRDEGPLLGGIGVDLLTLVSYAYFGEDFLNKLLQENCGRVFVFFQESNQSSIAELAKRIQTLLSKVVLCGGDSRGSSRCGVLAHSKAGAAVTLTVRECMNSSENILGPSGCRALSDVYVASGVNQGAGAAAIAAGVKEALDNGEQLDLGLDVKVIPKLLTQAVGASVVSEIAQTLFGIDVTGPDRGPFSNPLWKDLSPITEIAANTALVKTTAGFYPARQGNFLGEFAASATELKFTGGADAELSCGDDARNLNGEGRFAVLRGLIGDVIKGAQNMDLSSVRRRLAYTICSSGARAAALLHDESFKPMYLRGRASWERKFPDLRAELAPFTWETFQVSDGLVEHFSALGICERGLGQNDSAVTSCKTYRSLAHSATAGLAAEAAENILRELGPARK